MTNTEKDSVEGPYDLLVLRELTEEAAYVMRDFPDAGGVYAPNYMLALWYNTVLDTLRMFAATPEDSEIVPVPTLPVAGQRVLELLLASMFSLSSLAERAEEDGRYAAAARFEGLRAKAVGLLPEVVGHEVAPAEVHRRVSAFVAGAAFVIGTAEIV